MRVESVRYKEYERKIARVAEVVDKIRRRKVPILIALSVIVAICAALLLVKGAIIGDVEIHNSGELHYGESIDFDGGSVLMGKITLEYAKAGSDVWSTDTPIMPGDYRVRAVSKMNFGRTDIGQEFAFTIKPVELTVFAKEAELDYGSEPTPDGDGLKYGDKILSAEWILNDDFTTDKAEFSADVNSVVIVDADGNNVNQAYSIGTEKKQITVIPHAITLKTESAEKVYDGTALKADKAPEGVDLINGDSLTVISFPEICDFVEGGIENIPEFDIVNRDGKSVKIRYDIKLEPGLLKIFKGEITVKVGSQSFVYDGETHTCESWECDSAGLLETYGETVRVKNNTFAQVTNVGERDNTSEFEVVAVNSDGEAEDKSGNYLITVVPGIVEVTRRKVTLSSEPTEKEYDGQEISVQTIGIVYEGSFVEGHVPDIVSTEYIKAGTYNDHFSVKKVTVTDAESGKLIDVTKNYEITVNPGKITITPRRITVRLLGESAVYDGQSHTCSHYEISDGTALADGDKLSYTPEFRIDAGEYTMTPDKNNVRIKNTTGSDVSDCYDITPVTGILTISRRPVIITVIAEDKVFNGGSFSGYCMLESGENTGLIPGHTLDYKLSEFSDIGTHQCVVEWAEITDMSSGNSMNANYELTCGSAEFSIEKRRIKITAYSSSFVYDGNEHRDSGYTVYDYTLGSIISSLNYVMVIDTVLNAEIQGAVTNVWDNDSNEVISVSVMSGDRDITDCFEIETVSGILTVKPRNIRLTAGSAQKVYDAAPLTCDTYTVNINESTGGYAPVNGHTLHVTFYGDSQTNANAPYVKDNRIESVTVTDESGLDVTENYGFTLTSGTLSVKKRSITLKPEDVTAVYDGNAHQPTGCVDMGNSYYLVSGHRAADYIFNVSPVNAGQYSAYVNSVSIRDQYDNNVTDNYDISYEMGLITIEKRHVDVKVSDVILLECTGDTVFYLYPNYVMESVLPSSFVEGHYAYLERVELDAPEPGERNVIDYSIYSLWGNNYEFELAEPIRVTVTGSMPEIPEVKTQLTINPRQKNYTYDGQSKSYDTSNIECYGLNNGDRISYNISYDSDDRTNAGYKYITLTWTIYNTVGANVTAAYEVNGGVTSMRGGYLYIVPRRITLNTPGITKEYDRQQISLNVSQFSIAGGSFATSGERFVIDRINYYNLMNGVRTDNPIDVGEYSISCNMRVLNSRNEDVTNNYEIYYIGNNVIINRRSITVKIPGKRTEYTGEVIRPDCSGIIDMSGRLLEGDTLSAYSDSWITEVGSVPIIGDCTVTHNENGEDVTDKYYINIEESYLTVTQAKIRLIVNGIESVSLEELINDKYSFTDFAIYSGPERDIGKITVTINRSMIRADSLFDFNDYGAVTYTVVKNDVDVTENYEIKFKSRHNTVTVTE